VDLLVLDVDGVLTAGGVNYTDDGSEAKTFHIRDGSALKCWHQVGKRSALITGRTSPVVARRAAELWIETVIQGADDKLMAYGRLLAAAEKRPEQVCCVGDDLADLPLLHHCGLPVAVANACPEVRQVARYVTRAAGGHGAVREVIELLLRCQGDWVKIVERLTTRTFALP
jgi:YrbI family 3-deoxy-D-manno-octulosonate 8-phosphate phosphatase